MRLYGSQSMTTPLRRVVVKRPQEAFRDAATIAAGWRELNYAAPPDLPEAEKEFNAFLEILESHGVEVLRLPPDERTGIDSIYTHDPAIVTDAGAVIFQTGKAARRGEGPALADAFRKWGIPILGVIDGPATVEGGDAVWLDHDTLAVGRGFRTNAAGIASLKRLLAPIGVDVFGFDLPCWNGAEEVLHLQSVISLLDKDLAVIYERLLPVPLFEILDARKIELIKIPEEEFSSQACNVLAISPRRLVMLEGNGTTRKRLEEAGCMVQAIRGAEIAFKGSGGPTCLTRPLLRLT